MNRQTVLAIDPGMAKCGVAVLSAEGLVLHRAVVPTPQIATAVIALLADFSPKVIVMGDGTASKSVLAALRLAGCAVSVEIVEEHHTSELARKRYLAENPAKGLGKLVPQGLRTPDGPYDDWVAVILAERWLASAAG